MSVLTDEEIRSVIDAAFVGGTSLHMVSRKIERAVLDKLIAECEQQTKAAGTNSNVARGWGGRAHWLRSKRGEGNG